MGRLEPLIERFEKELQLDEAFSADGEGSWSLLLDKALITISEKDPGFELFALLDEIPEQHQEFFFTQMLRANLFGQATNNSSLGLDENGKRMVVRFICNKLPTYKEIEESIEDFFNTCSFWQREIEQIQQD